MLSRCTLQHHIFRRVTSGIHQRQRCTSIRTISQTCRGIYWERTNLASIVKKQFQRTMSTSGGSSSSSSSNTNVATVQNRVTEIEVPTPWGRLATKCWNLPSEDPSVLRSSPNFSPVVCLHGWQDNAGTWDNLIPLLDREIPFICVDWCGHGRSSPRPAGTSSDNVMHVWDLKRVVDFFGLKSDVNLMGHSLGGAISICFSATYPQLMNKCLTFDAPALFPRDAAKTGEQLASAIDKLLEFESSHKSAPKYSYDRALERFLKGRNGEMSEESARILLKRGLKRVPATGSDAADEEEDEEPLFEFSRDVKVTFPSLAPFTFEQAIALVNKVDCHLFLILFNQNHWARAETLDEKMFARYKKMRQMAFDVYEKNCRSFRVMELDGKHHGHLDDARSVAAQVDAFWKKGSSKL